MLPSLREIKELVAMAKTTMAKKPRKIQRSIGILRGGFKKRLCLLAEIKIDRRRPSYTP